MENPAALPERPPAPGLGRKGKGGMFSGEYRHNMDPKGRVTVPSKFREDLGERFYVCKGLDGCLFVLSQEQWDKLVEKVSAMPLAQGKGIQRYFFSGAAEVESFDENTIVMVTVQGVLIVRGEELHIEKLSLDGGDLKVEGMVESLTYEEDRSRRGGFFSRLLG